WSNVQLGQGEYGPLPITEYKDELWPDLEERFYAGSLRDVFFLGEFYGIPHRNGIRPMLYRSDYLEEAGFDKPPDTWQELSEYAQAITQRDAAGNTTRWGMEFGADANKPQQLITYYWQAGGEITTEDGRLATIDTPEMRDALDWMSEQLWTYEVVPPDFMEKAHNPMDLFTGEQVAILPQCVQARIFTVENDFPEIPFMTAICAEGPANRATYAGGGYWCVLRGTEHPYEAARFMQFLSRDENMKQWSELSGDISPNKSVMAADFWIDEPWKKALADSLEYAHSSQHATAAWSKLISPEPGAVLYDMFYEALVNRNPVDEVLARAQQRAQEEIDKAAGV
ncbi:extracellular solute-binding protein, partial [candidate division KSB3 bacterium]|nr:extracellular solute-binding protein [candidate division KSB3 bacterium]